MGEIYKLYNENEVKVERLVARLKEIELLARAGVELGFHDDPKLIDYLMARAMILGEKLGLDPEKVMAEELGDGRNDTN